MVIAKPQAWELLNNKSINVSKKSPLQINNKGNSISKSTRPIENISKGFPVSDFFLHGSVVVSSDLTSLSTIFQLYHNGDWLRQGAQCSPFRAASLKYPAPGTWHETTLSHIILTMCRPVLTLPRKSFYNSILDFKMPSEEQLVPFLTTLVCRSQGSNPWPPVSRSGHSKTWGTGAGLHGSVTLYSVDIKTS